MSIRIALAALALSAVAAFSAAPALAEVLDFSYTSASNGTASWTQASDPTPYGYYPGRFTIVPVSDGASSVGTFTEVTFASEIGGFLIEVSTSGIVDHGPIIFTGTVVNPIFSPGVFVLDSGTLTVTAVPEPSTWAMMLLGFAVLGFVGYRAARKGVSLAA